MELYTELGDSIAWQYGGSEAHKKNLGSSGPGKQVNPDEGTPFVLRSTTPSLYRPLAGINECCPSFSRENVNTPCTVCTSSVCRATCPEMLTTIVNE